ncbi:MAG: M28 family peptidase [Bacteroidota bacterium]|nr:MAG: M28 family peptidase [Bacteroidota bacterium]
MRLHLIFLFLFCTIGCVAETPDSSLLRRIANTLCSPEFQGRPPGSIFQEQVRSFLRTEIRSLGLKPHQDSFSFFDSDSNRRLVGKNIFAFLNLGQRETILIAAHYDHLGLDFRKSKDIRPKGFHPGANDNASGVAVVLYLMQLLKQHPSPKFNYLFVLFDAHEIGLYGSSAFCSKTLKTKIKAVINLDMVGRSWNQTFMCYSNRTLQTEAPFTILSGDSSQLGQLDTRWFYERRIPCYSFSSGQYADYHSTNDTVDKLNYSGMYLLATWLKDFLQSL